MIIDIVLKTNHLSTRITIENYTKALIMNFLNVNKFNAFVNDLSGNCFPVSSDEQLSIFYKTYAIGTFFYHVVFFVFMVKGAISIPTIKTVHDSVITLMVIAEIIILTMYMHCHRHKYRALIAKMNIILASHSEVMEEFIYSNISPVMKALKIYTACAISSIMIWVFMPILTVFNKSTFVMDDFRLPFGFINEESFGIDTFVVGWAFEFFGCIYNGLKKAAINIYIVHFVTLLTGQYSYLQHRLSTIFQNSTNEELRIELEQFLDQHRIVVKISQDFSKLFFINIVITYINSTLQFCILGFMLTTMPGGFFEKSIVGTYCWGIFVETYIMCFSIDRLQEMSLSVANQAFHEPWYNRKVHLQKIFAAIVKTNIMECRLSTCEPINLSLPNLKTILSNSYSACLLLLKMK